jgi:hypothetical protein
MEPAVLAGQQTDVEFGETHVYCGSVSGNVKIGACGGDPAERQVCKALRRRGERGSDVRVDWYACGAQSRARTEYVTV